MPELTETRYKHEAQILEDNSNEVSSTGREENVFEEIMERVKRLRTERVGTMNTYANELLQALRKYSGECMYCHACGEENGSKHEIFACPSLDYRSKKSGYKMFREGIKYKGKIHKKICYKCHVPQLNEELHG